MYNKTILLDMDGVLCDFVGGACKAHGWTRDQLEAAWPPGRYGMAAGMGLTPEEFWAPINSKGEEFWSDLEPMHWFQELIDLVEQLVSDNWYVVTAPSRHPDCFSGKAVWIKWHRGTLFNRLVITNHKHLLAKPGALLIDDREATIDKFVAAGMGRSDGILFPARHNSLHHYRTYPIEYLETILKERTDAPKVSERERSLPATRYGLH